MEVRCFSDLYYLNDSVLPSYSIMCKCYYCADKNTDMDYRPTLGIVRKVVDFFNANIIPATTTNEFISQKLAETDTIYTVSNSKMLLYNQRFISRYMMFYNSEDGIRGGLIDIFTPMGKAEDPKSIRATLLMGLRRESLFENKDIDDFLYAVQNPDKNSEKYIDLEREQYHAYNGSVELTNEALVAELSDISDRRNKMFISVDITGFIKTDIQRTRNYLGGLGYAMTANGPLGVRIMRFVMAERKSFSGQITMAETADYLNIPAAKGKYLTLNEKLDRTWYNFLAAKRRAEN